jgi:ABC-2 type transport system permease protein
VTPYVVRCVAEKEFKEIWRDGRFRAMVATLFLLLMASIVTGWTEFRHFRAEQDQSQKDTRRLWENQGAKNPHGAAHFGMYAFKPKMPLSFIDKGIDGYMGVTIWMEAHKQNPFLFPPAEDYTGIARSFETTAGSILQLLLPLLIILLSYGTFAGERDRGTLRQLMSLGVSLNDVMAGKLVARAVSLGLLLAPASIIGAAVLVLGSGFRQMADSTPRFVLVAFSYMAYLAGFGALAVFVSARASTERSALVILLGIWTAGVVMLPRVAADFGERLYATPSGKEFWDAIEVDLKNGADGHNPETQRTQELRQRVLKQYGVERVEELPVNFAGIALQAGEDYGNAVFDKHYAHLWDLYQKQDFVRQAVSLLVPIEMIRQVSMAFSGTDFNEYRHFAVSAENYRRGLNRTMNDALTYNSRGDGSIYSSTKDGVPYLGDASLWNSVPDFHYMPQTVAEIVAQQSRNLLWLGVWFLLMVAGASWQVARLRP